MAAWQPVLLLGSVSVFGQGACGGTGREEKAWKV